MNNYRPLSILSVPSKILESCVCDIITDHVTQNELITAIQWAYRPRHSTELLLAHLNETWRKEVDLGHVVGVIFIDFKKTFDSVSHPILIRKLQHSFGINGQLLNWIQSYVSDRKQFTVIKGKASATEPVVFGIPQGSVLGPALFTLYTNDLPASVKAGTICMYADDTTLYCTGRSVDDVSTYLNEALDKLHSWCITNMLTPHPVKCEAMLLHRGSFVVPLAPIRIGGTTIKWVTHSRLLGLDIDNGLTWGRHLSETRKSLASKLNSLKRSRFLPKGVLEQLYLKVIMPSITYELVVWGRCNCMISFNSVEALHRRAARTVHNIPLDTPSYDVLLLANWKSIYTHYKLALLKLIYKIYNNITPGSMTTMIEQRQTKYSLRKKHQLTTPRYSTKTMILRILPSI